MKEEKVLYEKCSICGSTSTYSKQALKNSTYIINGIKVIFCYPCEDDLFNKLLKARKNDYNYY